MSPVASDPKPSTGGEKQWTSPRSTSSIEQRATRLETGTRNLFSAGAFYGTNVTTLQGGMGMGLEGKGAAHAGNAVQAIAWRPVHYASGHLKTISFNSFSFLGLLKTTASQAASSSQIRSRLGLQPSQRGREREREVHLMPIPSAGRVVLMCVLNALRQRVLSGQEAVPASR